MKIFLANYSERQGGGWTFLRNLKKGLDNVTEDYSEADIYFVGSASMVGREEVEKAKADGKKVVLRCDNIIRNSRNRNTGMSRMKDFAQWADLVIYQSEYARVVLGEQFLKVDGPVILNGCDTSIFNPDGRIEAEEARFLYSRVNRDETKGWEMARFIYQEEFYRRGGNATLNIVGEFSPELQEYNFDFYNEEEYKYWGVIKDPYAMATIYKNSDYFLYTYWNDACSNSLIEALCSGCMVFDPYGMADTGGAPDIMHHFEDHGGLEFFTLERMADEYNKELARL